jgi:hypothetical protein
MASKPWPAVQKYFVGLSTEARMIVDYMESLGAYDVSYDVPDPSKPETGTVRWNYENQPYGSGLMATPGSTPESTEIQVLSYGLKCQAGAVGKKLLDDHVKIAATNPNPPPWMVPPAGIFNLPPGLKTNLSDSVEKVEEFSPKLRPMNKEDAIAAVLESLDHCQCWEHRIEWLRKNKGLVLAQEDKE